VVYRGLAGLVVLVIDQDLVSSELRYEAVPGWDTPFPHIYGPLNTSAVIETLPLAPGPDGSFIFPPRG
jgi:uncharacterized protein (DUF952 family)